MKNELWHWDIEIPVYTDLYASITYRCSTQTIQRFIETCFIYIYLIKIDLLCSFGTYLQALLQYSNSLESDSPFKELYGYPKIWC